MSDQESFISHLIELRQRLVRAAGAVLGLFVVLLIWPGSGAIYDFLAMPLMHSEAIADQRYCLEVYNELGPRFGRPFAISHHRMIARFGRFPHRNEVLGRASTAAEKRAVAAGYHW